MIKILSIVILLTVVYNVLFALLQMIFSKEKTVNNLTDDTEYKIGATILLCILFIIIILGGAEI